MNTNEKNKTMKRYSTTIRMLIFIPILVLTGCIGEDWLNCETENAVLEFSLSTTVTDSSAFLQRINSVDVLLFDRNNRFVTSKHVDRQALTQFQGTRLALTPGTYRVVCWANISNNTRTSPLVECETLLEQSYLEMGNISADTIYYAPAKTHSFAGKSALNRAEVEGSQVVADYTDYTMVVPQMGRVVKQMRFIRAYRSIRVYIVGLNLEDDKQPRVDIAGLSTHYDFLFNTLPLTRDYSQSSQRAIMSDNVTSVAEFFTAFAPIVENIKVSVKDLSGKLVYGSVNLRAYLEEFPQANHDDIEILFEFKENVIVNITLPTWNTQPVTPIF
jgi:hypothetical protein